MFTFRPRNQHRRRRKRPRPQKEYQASETPESAGITSRQPYIPTTERRQPLPDTRHKHNQELEQASPQDIKALLKQQSGSLSLSEILQQKNLSLADLLKGDHNALSALTGQESDTPSRRLPSRPKHQNDSQRPLRYPGRVTEEVTTEGTLERRLPPVRTPLRRKQVPDETRKPVRFRDQEVNVDTSEYVHRFVPSSPRRTSIPYVISSTEDSEESASTEHNDITHPPLRTTDNDILTYSLAVQETALIDPVNSMPEEENRKRLRDKYLMRYSNDNPSRDRLPPAGLFQRQRATSTQEPDVLVSQEKKSVLKDEMPSAANTHSEKKQQISEPQAEQKPFVTERSQENPFVTARSDQEQFVAIKPEQKLLIPERYENKPFAPERSQHKPLVPERSQHKPFVPERSEQKAPVPEISEQKSFVPERTQHKQFLPETSQQRPRLVPEKTEQKQFVPERIEQKPILHERTEQKPFVPERSEQNPFVPERPEQKPLVPERAEQSLQDESEIKAFENDVKQNIIVEKIEDNISVGNKSDQKADGPMHNITAFNAETSTGKPNTPKTSAKDEILEFLKTDMGSIKLARILASRNMTLSELIAHRERGSSQQHLADIFRESSTEPSQEDKEENDIMYNILKNFQRTIATNKDIPSIQDMFGMINQNTESSAEPKFDSNEQSESLEDQSDEKSRIFDSLPTFPAQLHTTPSRKLHHLPTSYSFEPLDPRTQGRPIITSRLTSTPANDIAEITLLENVGQVQELATKAKISPYKEDDKRFDIMFRDDLEDEVTSNSGLPEDVKSAIIVSSAILGAAILGFLTIFVVCRWKQKRARRRFVDGIVNTKARSPILMQPEGKNSGGLNPVMVNTSDLYKMNCEHHMNPGTRKYYLWRTIRKTLRYK